MKRLSRLTLSTRPPKLALVLALVAPPTFGAHPLQTEDTATQGVGNLELENGLSYTRAAGTHVFSYLPQLSCGAATTFDLILQPSWLQARAKGDGSTRGLGDTNADLKWRFYGSAPLSLALRGGVTLPTSRDGLGLSHGVAGHVVLAAMLDLQPFTVSANLGYSHYPRAADQRREVGRASAAVMWALDERLVLTAEAGAEANADPTRSAWTRTALAGVIYTPMPALDLDVGYQSGLGGVAPARQWLAGITYRFAL